jgi:hypothetical protein
MLVNLLFPGFCFFLPTHQKNRWQKQQRNQNDTHKVVNNKKGLFKHRWRANPYLLVAVDPIDGSV